MVEVERGTRGLGMGGHHEPYRGGKDEWLTPPDIIEALGPFDLDPCAPVNRPWDMAAKHYTIEDDGLSREWEGYVWCNPPYGPQTWTWLDRMAQHGNGIALTFARTETRGYFGEVWEKATAMLYLKNRLFFHHVDGSRAAHNSGAPSVLIAYGVEAATRLYEARTLAGAYVIGWEVR